MFDSEKKKASPLFIQPFNSRPKVGIYLSKISKTRFVPALGMAADSDCNEFTQTDLKILAVISEKKSSAVTEVVITVKETSC